MAANRQQYELHGIAMTEEAFEQLISVESLPSHIQAIVR